MVSTTLINRRCVPSALLSTLALILFFVVDIFKANAPVFPALPLSLAASAMSLSACPLTHRVGTRCFPAYLQWQPFKGPRVFVLLQAVGWFCYSFSVLLIFLCVVNGTSANYDGAFVFIGVLGLFANVLLQGSLHRFQPTKPLVSKKNELSPTHLHRFVWNGEAILSLALSVGACLSFLWIDVVKGPYTSGVLLWCSIASLLSMLVTHMVNGPQTHPDWVLYQPFVGGHKFVTLQFLGWAFCSFFILGTSLLLASGPSSLPFGPISSVSVLGVLSNFLLLASLPWYQGGCTPHVKSDEANKVAKSLTSSEIMVSLFLCFGGIALLLCADALSLLPNDNSLPTTVRAVAFVALHLSAPVAHCTGGPAFSSRFRLWQPFCGGVHFVVLQVIGWTLYAVSLLLSFITLFRAPTLSSDVVVRVGVLSFFSQLLVILSVGWFDPKTYPRGSGITHIDSDSDHPYSLHASRLPREAYVSGFLAFGAFCFVVVADFMRSRHSDTFPVRVVLMFSLIAYTFALMLCHAFAGPRRFPGSYRLWQPFEGGAKFVFLTSFSYTLYAVTCIIFSIISFNAIEKVRTNGVITFSGFLGLAACALQLGGLMVFDPCQPPVTPFVPGKMGGEAQVSAVLGFLSLLFCALVDLLRSSRIFFPLAMFAGIAQFLGPVIHTVGGKRHRESWWVVEPFRGGIRSVMYSICGWTLCWGAFLLFTITFYHGPHMFQFDGLMTGIGVMTFSGQLCLLQSLRYYDPDAETAGLLERNGRKMVAIIVGLCSLILFVTVELLLTRTSNASTVPALPLIVFAAVSAVCAAPVTSWLYRKKKVEEDDNEDEEDVINEDSSNDNIAMLLTASWLLYSLTAFSTMICVYYGFKRVYPIRGLMALTGTTGVVAQLTMLLALELRSHSGSWTDLFSAKQLVHHILLTRRSLTTAFFYTIHLCIWSVFLGAVLLLNTQSGFVLLFYVALRAFVGKFLCDLSTIALIAQFVSTLVYVQEYPSAAIVDLIVYALGLVYCTSFNDSHMTGRRRSNAPSAPWLSWFWEDIASYFSFSVVGTTKLDKDAMYLYGVHPHGIYPGTAIWGRYTNAWKERFGEVFMDFGAATIMFQVGGMREIGMWMSGRDVSSKSITHALSTRTSVILVPGGQAEMRESRSSKEVIVLVNRHKGFVRLALQHGASLVPCFAFGEHDLFDNVYLPKIQAWFVKKFGFGYPHFPYGRWYLPIPRPRRLTLAVGDPLPLPHTPQPSPEAVDRYHAEYFSALERLFEAHKAGAGYPDARLEYADTSRHVALPSVSSKKHL